ncbi:MAG: hypothetical protein HY917_00170 [Candidatus Diapherotrites archaeon]|nr:hypothetical protein [Candidatus Diapherotrites archaeon]
MFEKKDFSDALAKARQFSLKRKFSQSVELIINFAGLNIKKTGSQIDVEVKLPHVTGKIANVKTLVFLKDKQFAQKLQGKATRIIMDEELPSLKKKDMDVLMNEYPVFLAEGPSMLSVAKYFGQQLAPKNRMPKLVPSDLNAFDELVAKMSSVIKVSNKRGKILPLVQVMLGKEAHSDEALAENGMAVFNAVFDALGKDRQKIRSVYVKLTMGSPVKLGHLDLATDQNQKPVKAVTA